MDHKTNLFLCLGKIYFLILFFVCIGCADKPVEPEIKQKNGFSVIVINTAPGKHIEITAVDTLIGAMGYEIKGKIYWLKGLPERSIKDKNTIYTWEKDQITLTLKEVAGDFEFSFQHNDKQNIKPCRWFMNIKAFDNEYFTGLFERVVDGKQGNSWSDSVSTAVNLRGEIVEMKIKPTVSAYAPFYLSSENYGLFVQGTWPGIYDLCKTNKSLVKISFEGPSFMFKVYTGNPADIVKKHTMETGPVFLPPQWAFGPWRWRDEHSNNPVYYDGTKKNAPYNTDIVEDVLLMEAYDIPVTAVWIDRPWCPGPRGFDDYEFDTMRIPKPDQMIKWLKNKNLELMMWIAPFVSGKMADYAEEKGYHLISKEWMGSRQVLMDFTNKEANNWWGKNGPGKLARMGIRGFKLDRADGEKLTDSIHLYTSIGTSYRENYNDFPRQYVKTTYDAVKNTLGNDFILFPRAQYTGSAYYGALWAGDTNGKQEGLRSAIIALLRCAVMGYPIWGSDVGGYWGLFDHEVTQRWLGLGCFSPIMEVGPTNNKGFWNNPTEPFYDTNLIATWRLYSKIRMKLQPYIHNLATEANKSGMPVARPLFLLYPEQPEAWNDWQTYLLGNDLLVSIIWKKGITRHKLYLPKGETWIDAWDTSKEYSGGIYIEVDAPTYKTPVFIKKGSSVDLGNLNELWKESLKMASQKPNISQLEKKEKW